LRGHGLEVAVLGTAATAAQTTAQLPKLRVPCLEEAEAGKARGIDDAGVRTGAALHLQIGFVPDEIA
jgi:hypothetical protein